jgi:hypothetical protein
MTTMRTVTDELESIVQMFCEKYPDRSEAEIDVLVHDAYAVLAAQATVTAHLIPLTVNRCHKLLSRRVGVASPIRELRQRCRPTQRGATTGSLRDGERATGALGALTQIP